MPTADLRRDWLAGPIGEEDLTVVEGLDPGLDVESFLAVRRSLLCHDRR